MDTVERVPMGASDLKASAQKMFRNALLISCGVHLAIIGAYIATQLYKPPDEAEYTGRVIRMETLPPPPPLSSAPPPPVIPTQQIVQPTIGVPVPVPDAEAPEEQTIMTQQELSQALAPVGLGSGSGKDTLVIASNDLPSEGEFVYYEDPPTPVQAPPPVYPEFARDAGIQGKVILHVLVGKDGRVKNAKVQRSVTGLDDAALKAVKGWVFKPALSNNKPVAVWVEVPVDFHF